MDPHFIFKKYKKIDIHIKKGEYIICTLIKDGVLIAPSLDRRLFSKNSCKSKGIEAFYFKTIMLN